MENKQEIIEKRKKAAFDGRGIFFIKTGNIEDAYNHCRMMEDWRGCHKSLNLFLSKVNERINGTDEIKKKLKQLEGYLTPRFINFGGFQIFIGNLIDDIWYDLNDKSKDLLLPTYEESEGFIDENNMEGL